MSATLHRYCTIDTKIYEYVKDIYGGYYSKNNINKVSGEKIASDVLNPEKALLQAEILERYTGLYGKKTLEIGSGFGINHIVWTKKYGIDGWGIEPDGEGFESSYKISKELLTLNNLNAERITSAYGEAVPFADNSFDIVYSTNVLEHVSNPAKVLAEALRVLKPGGTMQFVFPNYHSWFDGHYCVIHPPVPSNGFFQWYVKNIFGRNPGYAKTLRTELNVGWTKKQVYALKQKYEFEVVSLGKEIFLERMKNLNFETWGGLAQVKNVLKIVKRLRLNYIAAKLLVCTRGFSPIILTIKKQN